MTLEEAFIQIESEDPRIACASASHMLSAVAAVKASEAFRTVAARVFLGDAGIVASRLNLLLNKVPSDCFRSEYDVAIMTYLVLLNAYSPLVAMSVGSPAVDRKDLWWSRQFAASVSNKLVADIGEKSDGVLVSVQHGPDARSEATGTFELNKFERYELAFKPGVLLVGAPMTAA